VACSSAPIDSEVTSNKVAGTYSSFSVTTENIPAFLGPIITSNFDVAMAARGLQPTDETNNPDLNVHLRFQQIDLDRGGDEIDSYDEVDSDQNSMENQNSMGGQNSMNRISMDESLRFIARIVIEIRETGKSDIIWSGQVQRIHDVSPGEWMHTGNASIAFLDAFNKLLVDFQ